jgi:hypothetical protein
MKIRYKIIVILLLSISSYAMCQSKKVLFLINNDSIKYELLRPSTSLYDSNRIEIEETRVSVILPTSIKKKLLRCNKNEWIKLLENSSTDWAANLCLYDIFLRDALIFVNVKNKEAWRACCKSNDIYFWKDFLERKL